MDWVTSKFGAERVPELIEKARAKPALAAVLDRAGHDVFGVWLIFVNRSLRPLGVAYSDLADWTWRDAFDDGMSPAEAAREALSEDEIGQLIAGV